jgi:hypothetical protein
LVFDALDDECDHTIRSVIGVFGGNNFLDSGYAFLVRRWLARQRFARTLEIGVVEKLHEGDNVAALVAAAAIENLFLCIDAEPILAGAFGAGTAALDLAPKFDSAAGNFILEGD